MDLESVSIKHLSELEQLISQALVTMRKAKLAEDPRYAVLQELEQELGNARRKLFDATNSKYSGY